MPIYEYEPTTRRKCRSCAGRFEVIQGIHDPPLEKCPDCGQPVKKVMSWCRAAIVETSEEHAKVEKKITEYEREGMWSHAAELADKHSEKIKDTGLKMRALDDYKKAGYDVNSLEKHIEKNS